MLACMHRAFLGASLSLLSLACGSTVVTQGSASASGTGGATSTSVTTASGQGGVQTSVTATNDVSATQSSSSTGGSGGGISCGGFIVINGDGPEEKLFGSCPSWYGASMTSEPLAYFTLGGGFISTLFVTGCTTSNADYPAININAFNADSENPGQYNGSITYTDASNITWSPTQMPDFVAIMQISDMTGDAVEGAFKGTVVANNQVKALSGWFRVCKVADLPLP